MPRAPFTRAHRSEIEKLEKLLKRGMSDASDLQQIRMINSVVLLRTDLHASCVIASHGIRSFRWFCDGGYKSC